MKHSRQEESAPITSRFNVDEKDVEFLSNLAGDWWDPRGSCKALHLMNQVSVPLVRNGLLPSKQLKSWRSPRISDELNGFMILDVGCGAGLLSEALGKLGAEVVGIDPSEVLIATAKQHFSDSDHNNLNVKYYCELIEDHVMKNAGKYDAVVTNGVIEHVIDPKVFLESCVKALKPGGSIFITTFNKTWIAWFCAIILGEFVFGLIPKHSHKYDQFISPKAVSKILDEQNCRTTRVVGFRYEFFRNVFKFQWDTSIAYGLQAVKQCSQETNVDKEL